MHGETLFALAMIGILGMACQWLAWWARLPAILFLLLGGIVAGPVTGWLQPDILFNQLLFPIVSLSVAVILFEGSLTLKIHDIKGLGTMVRNLISVGAALTWVGSAVTTHYLLDFSWQLSFLFGAVVIVTGPTVIIPMLRTVRPNAKISNILRWEGITIDPLGALMAVLVFDFIISGQGENAIGNVLVEFSKIILVGGVNGTVAALALGYVLRQHLIPEYLRNVLALTLVFGVFALSDLMVHESGLLAVTLMGMILANMKDTNIDDILDFKESLSVLLISGLFIILAARVEFHQFQQLGTGAVLVLLILMFIIRPVAVWLCAIGSDLTFSEKTMIAWIGPRGIVAAAVAALFAIRLEEAGYSEATLLVPLTFLIIIGTVVIQSATAKHIARWLGVREPPPTGVLIIGAGNVARVIGKALQSLDLKVVLTDSNWENTSLARMEGMNTYYGNPISEHADRNLDLLGLGKMIALSGRGNLDTLASLRFRKEFGSNNVYELKTNREQLISDKHQISTRHRGYKLFGEDVTYGKLANWIGNGAEIKKSKLRDEYDFESYLKNYEGRVLPLFALDTRGRLQIFTSEKELKPSNGWQIISLILPKDRLQATAVAS
jgi:CPA1 family monovalent cation:H+ antiporter